MIENLKAFTIDKGAPFPFDVEFATSLQDWEPRPRCIAVCEETKQFRVLDSGSNATTANALRKIVSDATEGQLTEWSETTESTETATETEPEAD